MLEYKCMESKKTPAALFVFYTLHPLTFDISLILPAAHWGKHGDFGGGWKRHLRVIRELIVHRKRGNMQERFQAGTNSD
jgi:hypothetical protein